MTWGACCGTLCPATPPHIIVYDMAFFQVLILVVFVLCVFCPNLVCVSILASVKNYKRELPEQCVELVWVEIDHLAACQ